MLAPRYFYNAGWGFFMSAFYIVTSFVVLRICAQGEFVKGGASKFEAVLKGMYNPASQS